MQSVKNKFLISGNLFSRIFLIVIFLLTTVFAPVAADEKKAAKNSAKSGQAKNKKNDKKKGDKKKKKDKKEKITKGDIAQREYSFKGKIYKVKDYVKDMMVKVPAGEFLMGSPANEEGRSASERQHKVKISKEFYIGKYEVTQDFYYSVMGRRGVSCVYRGESRPVENISWRQALEFCKTLNRAKIAPAGYYFFLPTEAEWEYAARGGAKQEKFLYAGGNNIEDVAIYSDNGKNFTKSNNEVGGKKPNSLGLYDMSGSVAEWCWDWYAPYPRTKAPLVDPRGPKQKRFGSYNKRVVRGGYWCSFAENCRVAARGAMSPGFGIHCGMRLVLIKPSAKKKAPAAVKKPAKPVKPVKVPALKAEKEDEELEE